MRKMLREAALKISSLGFPSILNMEKLLSLSILSRVFNEISSSRRYKTREDLWVKEIGLFSKSRNITYLEFGVWQGASIAYIANAFTNENNIFFGFDSFVGLPEPWDTMTDMKGIGSYSNSGKLPELQDNRVRFIEGWFQNSVDPFVSQIEIGASALVVHYDADLYSSTLYCLMQVDRLKTEYLAIFDEFPGHEVRALYNYVQVTGATVDIIGKVGQGKKYASQIAAIIKPCREYLVL